MDQIELAIREKLTGDAQTNALNFLEFLRANEWQVDSGEEGNGEGWAFGGVVAKSLGYLLINGAPQLPGPWTIWFNSCDFGSETADENLKQTAWAHASECGRCHDGWKDCGSGERTIFGKRFGNLCHSPLMFTNPDAETLALIKELAQMGMRTL